MATVTGVLGGLAMGAICLCGSDEQRERLLPPIARYEKIGSLGLTEPEVGSGLEHAHPTWRTRSSALATTVASPPPDMNAPERIVTSL